MHAVSLRSFKLVQFRGAREIHARDLPPAELRCIERPEGVPPGVVLDALRFALVGDLPAAGDILSPEDGFAIVEVGLRLAADDQSSVFRGLDRRGAVQVSLREQGGLRVSGGAEPVARRLRELLCPDLAAWSEAVIVERDSLGEDWLAPRLRSASASESASDAAAEAAQHALTAVGRLRASLRADRLRLAAAERHADVLDEGRRLRRERAIVAVELDRVNADRERVRARLRGLEEFSAACADLAQTARPALSDVANAPAAPPDEREFVLPWMLLTTSSILFLSFVLVATAPAPTFNEPTLLALLGTGCLLAFLSFLVVVRGRRLIAASLSSRRAGPPAVRDAAAARVELRRAFTARFPDISDPNDPAAGGALRQQLESLGDDEPPLQTRLERLDDLLALFDVEAGRAARALHLPLPEHDVGASGLAADDTLEGMGRSITALGDAIYQATVERDALRAGGAIDPREARSDAVRALEEVAAARGDGEGAADALAARLAAHTVGGSTAAGDEQLCSELEQSLRNAPVVAPREPARVPGGGVDEALRAASGELYDHLRCDASGRLQVVDASGKGVPFSELTESLQGRIALALRVRLATQAVTASGGAAPPGFVVLEELPPGLHPEAAFAAVTAGAGAPLQVIVA